MSATDPDCPFPETADIHTSSDEYATRFAGPAGQWMLDVQERITLRMAARLPEATILDVGGGHGQLTLPLCRQGRPVTTVGSDESCRTRIREAVEEGRCRFLVGNVIDLPLEDGSFDLVLCFRLLTHCERWPELVRELCRVARRGVIVDYPTSQSLNAVAPALFGAKKKFEKNTRTWALFRHRQVVDEFARHGFAPVEIRKQFFLPMVLHRMLNNRRLSAAMEAVCRGLGLTRLWGSPVIVLMMPRGERPETP
ncbi:MAG: methyltransferase domain-containing protein [Lentisphaerae bacterium]|nr:methyltransferase domain-containing protein [Lentisphaerota bacterium]